MLADIQLYPNGSNGLSGFGKLGLENTASSDSIPIFNKIISTTIGILTVVAILWFLITLLTGALSIISSGGDKDKIAQARNRIFAALIGLIIVIAATFILNIVGAVLGINFLSGAWFIPLLTP